METNPKSRQHPTPPHAAVSRRTVFAGAGAAGAIGALAAAASLPGVAPAPEKTADARADTAGGYQLTDHVKRYYATARL